MPFLDYLVLHSSKETVNLLPAIAFFHIIWIVSLIRSNLYHFATDDLAVSSVLSSISTPITYTVSFGFGSLACLIANRPRPAHLTTPGQSPFSIFTAMVAWKAVMPMHEDGRAGLRT